MIASSGTAISGSSRSIIPFVRERSAFRRIYRHDRVRLLAAYSPRCFIGLVWNVLLNYSDAAIITTMTQPRPPTSHMSADGMFLMVDQVISLLNQPPPVSIMPSDRPPAYSHRDSPFSPSYSAVPDDSERTLHHTPASPTSPNAETILSFAQSATEFIYRNKHVELNLGPKLWGTKSPSYGLGGVVEGQLTLVGDLTRVASVQVKVGDS